MTLAHLVHSTERYGIFVDRTESKSYLILLGRDRQIEKQSLLSLLGGGRYMKSLSVDRTFV